jgi:hypothetical protein
MSKDMIDGGHPAFAFNVSDLTPGVTKREYFAIHALQGMLANPSLTVEGNTCAELAEWAWEIADRFIEAGNQGTR